MGVILAVALGKVGAFQNLMKPDLWRSNIGGQSSALRMQQTARVG